LLLLLLLLVLVLVLVLVLLRRRTRRTRSRPVMCSALRRPVNAVNGASAISASLTRRWAWSSQTALG